MRIPAIYQTVQTLSLERVVDDHDNSLSDFAEGVSDQGIEVEMSTSNLDMQKLRSLLTTRQVQVLALIQAGYTRRQIAARLKPQVCKQAVHQIVGRMRIRLHVMAGVPLQGWRRRNGTY